MGEDLTRGLTLSMERKVIFLYLKPEIWEIDLKLLLENGVAL